MLGCEIVEAPIGLVDSDSERLAMTPVVIFSELCNRNGFFVAPDSIPEASFSFVSKAPPGCRISECIRWDAHNVYVVRREALDK